MKKTVDDYVARLLMIDRLEYKKADADQMIRLEENADPSIHNERLAEYRILSTVLEREITTLRDFNAEDMFDMHTELMQ